MKYICLGYIEPNKFETMSESERDAMLDECFTYDDILRKKGHFADGEALQGPYTATTLRWNHGKVSVADGPYAETKEQLGGILVLEARDLNHAIQVDVETPGCEGRTVRDTSCCGPHRNDPRERTPARRRQSKIKMTKWGRHLRVAA
jgi:hypothetical protein